MKNLLTILTFSLLATLASTATAQSLFSSRSLAGKLRRERSEHATAVDNTSRLLAEADSLAALEPDESTSRLYLPIVYTSYRLGPQMSLKTPDLTPTLTASDTATIN